VIELIAAALRTAGLEPTWEDVADTLWLARELSRHGPDPEPSPVPLETTLSAKRASSPPPKTRPTTPSDSQAAQTGGADGAAGTPAAAATAALHLPPAPGTQGPRGGLPFQTPAATALPGALALGQALRPLMRRVPSATALVLDAEGTVERAAEERIWMPVLRPARTRWLDLALVIDQSPSMAVWARTVEELRRLFERHGAFRDVRVWLLDTGSGGGRPTLYAGTKSATSHVRPSTPRELIDPGGRRLILLVSDCVAPAWSNGAVSRLLALWGRSSPVAVVHVLPQRLWRYTSIETEPADLRAPYPGAPNARLDVVSSLAGFERELEAALAAVANADGAQAQDTTTAPAGADGLAIPVPVVALQARWLAPWASLVAGAGGRQVPGVITWARQRAAGPLDEPTTAEAEPAQASPSAAEVVERFRALVSPTAFELAGYLAAVPLTLPVMRLVQQAMLPGSAHVHLAEVLLGGVLERRTPAGLDRAPDEVEYDFIDGVRELLQDTVLGSDTMRVIHTVGDFVARHAGRTHSFPAMLLAREGEVAGSHEERAFAAVTAKVLRQFGGLYAEVADRLEEKAVAGAPAETTPPVVEPAETTPPVVEPAETTPPVVEPAETTPVVDVPETLPTPPTAPPSPPRGSKRRRRLDPVGPFGNPDGSQADIEDVISEFVDFGGDPAFGHLAIRANDSMVRVIVGKLGSGKTVYLRRLQDFQAHDDSVYADVPQQSLPRTEVIVKACQWFADRVLVEKWMQIWERAIMRSLASHVLRRPELRRCLSDAQAEELEHSYTRLLDEFRRPRSIYSQVRDIINQRQTAHQLSTYLDDPLWDDLEDLVAEIVPQCPPMYFYLDTVAEEFGHAPMYWLKCQEGLFYQVMRFIRDTRLAGRLHIVVCIRDIVMASVYRSEHAPRYYNEPHIRVLAWDRAALLYLLQRKLQRLPPSVLMRRPATAPPTVSDWLGVDGSWPVPDGDGTIEDYLLSHTRLIPRDIISLGNELTEEVLRQKQAGREGVPPAALQEVVQRCARRFGNSQLAQCANQISSDLMPKDAALHDYSELYTSTQAYISGVLEDVRSFVRMIGIDQFPRADLAALQEMADVHFERATDLASVLWQNGLLGYIDEVGRRRFYSLGEAYEIHLPPEVETYVLHPCLAYAVGGIKLVRAGSAVTDSSAARESQSGSTYLA
jgi:hypothetical protein